MKNITQLALNEKGIIKGFTNSDLSVKLMEMGCLPGVEVSLQLIAPFGDPLAIEVCGYQLSLRKEEASSILIEE